MFVNLHGIQGHLDNTSDFVPPDSFDGVKVILEQL